jgi:uncharacterized protein (TIGR03083 family)
VRYVEHVDAVEAEVGAISKALRAGSLDVTVPSCPEWTVAELAEHITNFSALWAHVLCEGTGRPKPRFGAMPSDADAVAAWFETAGRDLVAELRATAPDTTVWTWHPDDQSAAFVARRAAHELAIHRYDTQLARNCAQPIDAAVAADGIEEIFAIAPAREDAKGGGNGETLHLHGTDRGDEWVVAMTPNGFEVERAHGEADLALRGAVSDLELTLYQRPTVGTVERFGSEDAFEAWTTAFTFA